jgi:hypothetical protein
VLGELAIEQEEGKPAEMIAMKMRNNDRIDGIEPQAKLFPRTDRTRAKIDEDDDTMGRNHDAGMGATAAPKSVARSDNGDFHESENNSGEIGTRDFNASSAGQSG